MMIQTLLGILQIYYLVFSNHTCKVTSFCQKENGDLRSRLFSLFGGSGVLNAGSQPCEADTLLLETHPLSSPQFVKGRITV
jgi:hypothetical protein